MLCVCGGEKNPSSIAAFGTGDYCDIDCGGEHAETDTYSKDWAERCRAEHDSYESMRKLATEMKARAYFEGKIQGMIDAARLVDIRFSQQPGKVTAEDVAEVIRTYVNKIRDALSEVTIKEAVSIEEVG